MNTTVKASSKLFVGLTNQNQVRGMATLKDLKVRLGTVQTISKLTKTLHMVASSKLRSAEKKAEELGAFNVGPSKLLSEIKSNEALDQLEQGTTFAEDRSNKQLVIAITTDTGMCGPVNHQVVKACKALLSKDTEDKMIASTTGLKGTAPLATDYPKKLLFGGRDFGKQDYSFPETLLFLNEIIAKIPNFDNAVIVYNKFKNALSYSVDALFIPGFNLMEQHRDKFYTYQTTEDRAATMKDLSEFYLASAFWASLYQNRASEMAGRMVSMDNASKNGESISQGLSLQYNRARQAMITSELIEITSGAAAIEDSN
ncbi:hypothetical protein CYY_003595 [Polysphondylium violaceum]|uniref:ATP synthase subunit gamma n=1 Tax=Polysphondylium violaceum TaxID=133409 RepID=A0A8J4V108_9MYCE|nr:hypothetical protein CYY_003595 [Polysphondylium violaceum]